VEYDVRLPLIAVLFIAVTGCTHTQQTAGFLDPYVGHTLAEVVGRFGPPSVNFGTGDGFMTFQWDHFGTGQPGGSDCRVLISASPIDGDAMVAPPEERDNWIVKSWHAYGGGCQ
jgi:hypothetical protein